MWNVFARVVRTQGFRIGLSLFALTVVPAARLSAQAQVDTPLRRQLHRLDLGISVIDAINGSTSGENYATSNPRPAQAEFLQAVPTNAVGGLATIRYTRSPLVGAEFNYSYTRYTTNYSAIITNGVQSSVSEYTLGYVVHGPALTSFAIQPFAAVGLGTTAFKPTTFGGEGLREQARATYYYSVGVDAPLLLEGRLGVRAQLHQAFYLAPDYGQSYLTIKQRTSSLEPGIGIYLHF